MSDRKLNGMPVASCLLQGRCRTGCGLTGNASHHSKWVAYFLDDVYVQHPIPSRLVATIWSMTNREALDNISETTSPTTPLTRRMELGSRSIDGSNFAGVSSGATLSPPPKKENPCHMTDKGFLDFELFGLASLQIGAAVSRLIGFHTCHGSPTTTNRHPIAGRLYAIPVVLVGRDRMVRCRARRKVSTDEDRPLVRS
jgi:hypothetical protein